MKIVAAAGRLLDERGAQPGAPAVAVLGHRYWQRHFNGDPGVVNRVLRVNSTHVQVLGILPADFDGLGPPRRTQIDIWLPITNRPLLIESSGSLNDASRADCAIYGMLVPGATMGAATAQLRALTAALRNEQPALPNDSVVIVPLIEPPRFEADVALLYVLFFLVFFSACANLGNMLLARGLSRYREVDLRLAQGASPRRVVRQLLTEHLLLAALGCAAGTFAGYAGAKMLPRYFDDLPAGVHLAMDARMVFASVVMVIIAMLGSGVAPAIQAVRRRQSPSRIPPVLVAIQVAASVALLIIAALLTRSEEQRQAIDLAIDYRRTLVVDPQFSAWTLPASAQWAALDNMSARLEVLPGVDGVTMAVTGPVSIGPGLFGQQVAPSYFHNRSGGEAYIPVSNERLSRVALLVHAKGDPTALLRDARAAAPVGLTPTTTTMEATLNLQASRGRGGLIGILGSLATLLAFTGIFGLVAFAVAQKRREIAVRVALGAQRGDVVRTVVVQYVMPLACGAVAGIAMALAGSQALRSQLHGLAALDPMSYALGIGSVALVALGAMMLPVRRALRIDPVSALRWE